MRKKFLSALLLGALTIASTSTFVSCKDYDDDISTLRQKDQSLEDIIAQKEKVMQDAINGLKQADQDLQSVDQANLKQALDAVAAAKADLEAAYKAADKTAADKAAADLAAAKTALEQAIADAQKACNDKAASDLAAAQSSLNDAIAAANDAITANKAAAEAADDKLAADLAAAAKTAEDNLAAAVKKVEDELAAAQATLTAAYEAADAVVLAAAKTEVANAKKILEDALAEEKAAREALANAHDKDIEEVRAEIVALDAKLSAAIAKAQGAAEAAQATADSNTAKIAEVVKDLATANEKINALQSDLQAALARIGALETALEGQKAALAQEIKDREAAINGEKSAREAADAAEEANRKAADEAEKNAREDADANLQQSLSQEISERIARCNEIAASVTALQNELAAAKTELETKINELATQVAADLAAAKTELEGNINDVSTSLEALKSSYNTFSQTTTEAVNTANNRLNGIDTQIADVKTTLNSVDTRLNVLDTFMGKDLRSLVFMPKVYVDGIEAIAYPFLQAIEMKTKAGAETFGRNSRREETPVSGSAVSVPQIKIPTNIDYQVPATGGTPYVYGPEIAAQYHMNPATANTKFEDLLGFAQRDTKYINRYTTDTRAAQLVELAEKNAINGKEFFKNENGIMTVGLKVTNVAELNQKENYVVALQSKTSQENATITSDYALIYAEKYEVEGIAWAKKNARVDANGNEPDPWDEDECQFTGTDKKDHIFDTPKEALLAEPSIMLEYNAEKGVKLGDYILTHFKQTQFKKDLEGKWAFGEEQDYGLTYEFKLVNYEYTTNLNDGTGSTSGPVVRIDSKYAKLQGDTIIATAFGDPTKAATEMAIGREPLVQVILKDANGKVVKDAYILVRIVAGHLDKLKEVKQYDSWTVNQNNCGNLVIETPNNLTNNGDWRDSIIVKLLNNEFDFLTFNGMYKVDGGTYDYNGSTTPSDAQAVPTRINDVTIYTSAPLGEPNGEPKKFEYTKKNGTKDQIARIDLQLCEDVTTHYWNSYHFVITLTKDEQEALTHNQTGSVTKDFYIRWTATSTRAPYKHIYQKLTITIKRNIEVSGIKQKIDNYWFGLDGKNEGWDAMAFNVAYPQNGVDIATWSNSTLNSFVNNKVDFTNAALTNGEKFFLVPQNTVITDLEGTEWVITPRSGKNDNDWMKLYCVKNVKCDPQDWPLTSVADANRAYNAASVTDTAKLHSIMLLCNIDYTKGAFTNKNLYAVKKSEYATAAAYTKIAEMDQTTGDFTLVRTWAWDTNECADNNALDMVLNAIGYGANHSNISNEFHAWVGYAAENGCDVAVYTFDNNGDTTNKNFGIWTASWQRPINLVNDKPLDVKNAVKDAQTNGYYIPIYDLLAFYDWRGPVEGDMEQVGNKWLWSYYNIHRIDVDLNPENVLSDINGTFGDMANAQPLKNTTGVVRLYPATAAQHDALKPAGPYTFNTLIGKTSTGQSTYNSASKSADLVEYLEGAANGKANFGYIFYENNGLNVTKFTVRIPLTIYYEWGHIKTYIDVVVDTTLGY